MSDNINPETGTERSYTINAEGHAQFDSRITASEEKGLIAEVTNDKAIEAITKHQRLIYKALTMNSQEMKQFLKDNPKEFVTMLEAADTHLKGLEAEYGFTAAALERLVVTIEPDYFKAFDEEKDNLPIGKVH